MGTMDVQVRHPALAELAQGEAQRQELPRRIVAALQAGVPLQDVADLLSWAAQDVRTAVLAEAGALLLNGSITVEDHAHVTELVLGAASYPHRSETR